LADLIFWVSVACCVMAEIAIVRSALRVSTARSMSESGILRPRRLTEIAWTVLPALALATVLVFTWYAIHPRATPASPAAQFEHRS
jgi:heme/copper-type cytochrome/quinol oxidase subunit 2